MRELVRRAGLAEEVSVASRACRTDEIGSDTHAGTRRKLRAEGIPFERRRRGSCGVRIMSAMM